jgi:hypothetical protein
MVANLNCLLKRNIKEKTIPTPTPAIADVNKSTPKWPCKYPKRIPNPNVKEHTNFIKPTQS